MTREKQAELDTRKRDPWTAATGQAGRWIALDLDLRGPRTWYGPSWAYLGGVLTGGRLPLELRSLVILAMGWLVAEPLVGSLLHLSAEIAARRDDNPMAALPAHRWMLPYVQPGSPGQRLLDLVAAGVARLRWGWGSMAGAGERWLLLALITLLLSTVAGFEVIVLAGLALLGALVVAVGRPLSPEARGGLSAGHFLLGWLAGRGIFSSFDWRVLAAGAGLAMIWYAWSRRPPLAGLLAILQVLLACLLVAVHAPLSAGALLLLAVPAFVLWPESPSSQRTYLGETQVYLMLGLLVTAWGLAWGF